MCVSMIGYYKKAVKNRMISEKASEIIRFYDSLLSFLQPYTQSKSLVIFVSHFPLR